MKKTRLKNKSRKTIKKVLKITAVIIGLLVVVIAVLVVLNWESISIMFINRELHEPVAAIPEAAAPGSLQITRGESDWVCWRGANGDGRSSITRILTDWSQGLEKKWEVDFLCRHRSSVTWSAPVIQGNRLVVCGRDKVNDLVFCLNPENGSLIWKASYPAEAGTNYGTGSRATPWIDNHRVYTFGRSGDLVCWSLMDGSKLWHKNVNDEGGKEPKWGYSTSPLVTDTLVVVNAGGKVRTIAYDKMNGNVIWKSGRGPAGYAGLRTMLIEGKPVLLTFHGEGLAALALEDGQELWNTSWETTNNVNATTPVTTGDLVFITSGYGTGCELVEVSRTGARVVWKNKAIASFHSDPFIINGHIYGYSGQSTQNKGVFKCVELRTGIEKWSSNEMGWGTCVYVDGFLLCCDIKGNLYLMKPDPEKFIKVTGMPGALGKIRGAAWTVPVLANGKLYLRFKQKLVCYEIISPSQ
ncbi:MAG: PQQ-binding-like beta-propeller repeat protein [Candidatus Aminicenantes bacterium]|nr:PQQ-binding-like beta-propeller repeat protein [Candidatus Aminicenantes bacterium]NIM83607.1 PQQ-binding-like beta-propeller repeat protein [Candidatus Aminicenantes bacterium]NIN23011.1 PQQ-binding-like beta-propeller repeat protein [Candidatus Aminicenantes bacterium]NIN46748.1 PQQ-binding-like beta-propeller repeat protein [Candidatus Aminicenantes bacterium]NIN89655.1 PQQ-binding-like beta-propeller repeat protein [Candidatus Aminicenantes bacterium]